MPRARIKSFLNRPRLSRKILLSGRSLRLVAAIFLCAALCQGTHASDRRSDGNYILPDGWSVHTSNVNVKCQVQNCKDGYIRGEDARWKQCNRCGGTGHTRRNYYSNSSSGVSQWELPDGTRFPFRSALGTDNLTAIVLQYAMYDREAKKVLTADPTLAHLYNNHAQGFEQEVPGIEVMGAGAAQANGWYARKERSDRPPAGLGGFQYTYRYWYEKDAGHYIYLRETEEFHHEWTIRGLDDIDCEVDLYFRRVRRRERDDHPPSQGWRVKHVYGMPSSFDAEGPAPTLRVVP